MLINRAYKTELDPNNKQKSCFRKCAGAARFVYNWGLRDRIERYERGEKTNMYEQKKRFNALKKTEYTWICDVPYELQSEAFSHLDKAYQNFFRRLKSGEKPGFPNFKKRGVRESFTLRGSVYIAEGKIKLPIIGWVNLKEKGYIPVEGIKILSVNISERAGRWYASIQCQQEIPDPVQPTGDPIGVDVGIKSLAVLSDGTTFENPKVLKYAEKKLATLQRELSRRVKGSANREKTKQKIAKLHAQIANMRKHALHNVSHAIVEKQPSKIIIEDLNVKGMLKNKSLSKSISDASMSELHRQIEYKAKWARIDVIKSDRWFASSKTCSNCGRKKETLSLSERVFTCDNCGISLDRDHNAALNLVALGTGRNAPFVPGELECSNAPL